MNKHFFVFKWSCVLHDVDSLSGQGPGTDWPCGSLLNFLIGWSNEGWLTKKNCKISNWSRSDIKFPGCFCYQSVPGRAK